ncbi:MAG: apolipoprotein N-acyltransferase [Desulfonatronovibrio sp. MSAO_Bac4]|nr:MAG: apolipoprotein N-acyltransferase [Desulfonatronovibrio sp. MSAO_Bac4]
MALMIHKVKTDFQDVVLAAFLCIPGLFLSFANPVIHFPPFFFLFLTGLNHLGFRSSSGLSAFTKALILSGLAYSLCLYWIVVPVNVYGGVPLVLAIFCPLLLGFCVGLFAACYAFVLHVTKNNFNPALLGILCGCAWGGLEFIREYAFTGFPWLVSAQSFAIWPESIAVIRHIGSTGLAMIMASCTLWMCIEKKIWRIAGAGILAVVMGYGYTFPQHNEAHMEKTFVIVQGNMSQTIKWEQDVQHMTVEKYMDLTSRGLEVARPDLVIWPETAMPFYFQEPTELSFMVRNFAIENEIKLLTGAPAYIMSEDEMSYSLYNRAYFISEDGLVLDYYDKQRLVPFGEYIPLGRYIPFLDKLVHGEFEFSKGEPGEPLKNGELALGMLICYEIIFPGLARQRAASGANILVNISNDAWFGNTSAPEQHLHLSVLRAIEQNRFVLRSTNTGISAFIDNQGNIYAATNIFEDAVINEQAGLVEGRTVFNYMYWYINFTMVFIVLSALIYTFNRKYINRTRPGKTFLTYLL